MTAFRLIPFPVHAALRLMTGLLTMVVPFLAGFEAPATVMAIVLGACTVGVALVEQPDERGLTPVPVSALHAADWATVLAVTFTAALVAVDGDRHAGLVLAAIGLLQLGGNLTTRYSLRA